MKLYFIIIIVVLILVIGLLFYLLFKIYSLHIRTEEGTAEEEQALNGDAKYDKSSDKSSFSSDKDSSQVDLLDGKVVTTVQPDVKGLIGPSIYATKIKKLSNGLRSNVTISFGYSAERAALKVAMLEVHYLPKGKPGSSEPYIDIQISPYRHRTYRNPGYRRPLRGFINKPLDFRIEEQELKIQYLFVFFLRYDPFSRLKIDGEVCVKLTELDQDILLSGEPVVVRRELKPSNQEFTAFIFRLR